MSIAAYIQRFGMNPIEGNSGELPNQTLRLRHLSSNVDFKHILEIGCNAGHSTDLFLSSSLAHVTSFDTQTNEYIAYCKQYIDLKYPTRHTLIVGDSKATIPMYAQVYPTVKFDLIFMDGDHSFEGALADIINCKQVAHENTILVMDDVLVNTDRHAECTIGPTNAWHQGMVRNIVQLKGYESYQEGRGMVWGSYVF
uniref:Methyltransferase n=1 Tax=viral metagenome TaxID=1070528 RepID=A0A6C0KMP7_9ZZZZ